MLTFDLDDLDGTVLVSDSEELQVAVLSLFRFRVSIDLDAEVLSVRLPVDLALSYKHSQHENARERKGLTS